MSVAFQKIRLDELATLRQRATERDELQVTIEASNKFIAAIQVERDAMEQRVKELEARDLELSCKCHTLYDQRDTLEKERNVAEERVTELKRWEDHLAVLFLMILGDDITMDGIDPDRLYASAKKELERLNDLAFECYAGRERFTDLSAQLDQLKARAAQFPAMLDALRSADAFHSAGGVSFADLIPGYREAIQAAEAVEKGGV